MVGFRSRLITSPAGYVPGDIDTAPINPYWTGKGATQFHVGRRSRYAMTTVGTGVTYPDGWLRTPGVAGNGAYFWHGQGNSVIRPFSIVARGRVLSAGTAASIQTTGDAFAYGWNGDWLSYVNSANHPNYDGQVLIPGSQGTITAVWTCSTTEMCLYNDFGSAKDSSFTNPAVPSGGNMYIGYNRKSTSTDPCVVEYEYITVFSALLTEFDAEEIIRDPWSMLDNRQRRRIWVPQAGIAGLPTLSSATYVPGSLTTTAFRPRVTATY